MISKQIYPLIVAVALVWSHTCAAQVPNPCDSSATSWDDWLNCRIAAAQNAISAQVVNATATRGTIDSSSKATADPSIQTNSTSLVDTTSTPDLLGFASHIAKLDSKSAGGQQDSFTFYTTAYAFYAATQSIAPLDPAFYVKNGNWRRLSVFFGREVPDDASSAAVGPANIFGGKFLIINDRDLGKPENIQKIQAIVTQLSKGGVSKLELSRSMKALLNLDDNDINKQNGDFTTMLSGKLATKQVAVDNLFATYTAPSSPIALERSAALQTFDAIRSAKQFSINFLGKRHDLASSADLYRIEAAFDTGLSSRWDLTANSSFEYANFKSVGANESGGRAAVQGSWRVSSDPTATDPWIVYFSALGKWSNHASPIYEVQGNTSLPFYNGVTIPISFTWASQNEIVQEANVISSSKLKSKFGFTLDVSKLLSKSQ